MTIESVLLLFAMSVAAGLIGCFVIMRRMVLAADALSHVALPGIGVALLLQLHPLAGALAALLLGTLLIWGIERRALLATETVIGVVFSAALALGSMMTSGDELIHALLGKPAQLTAWELMIALGAAAGVIVFLAVRRREILVSLVSRDIATAMGISLRSLDLQFLLAFAVTVALGLRYLGVLLMGSLIIIPAATAKHLATTVRSMLVIAVAVAIAATLAGTVVARAHDADTGPVIIAMAALVFFGALLARSRAGVWRRRSAKAGS
jgi:ABC-type Mn2+/Zn2+ transport system permease subunit